MASPHVAMCESSELETTGCESHGGEARVRLCMIAWVLGFWVATGIRGSRPVEYDYEEEEEEEEEEDE